MICMFGLFLTVLSAFLPVSSLHQSWHMYTAAAGQSKIHSHVRLHWRQIAHGCYRINQMAVLFAAGI